MQQTAISTSTTFAAASVATAQPMPELDLSKYFVSHKGYLMKRLTEYGVPPFELDEMFAELFLLAVEYQHWYDPAKGTHPLTFLGDILLRTLFDRHYSKKKKKAWRRQRDAEVSVTPRADAEAADDTLIGLAGLAGGVESDAPGNLAVKQFLTAVAGELTHVEQRLLDLGGVEIVEKLPAEDIPAFGQQLGLTPNGVRMTARSLRDKLHKLAADHFDYTPPQKKKNTSAPQVFAAETVGDYCPA